MALKNASETPDIFELTGHSPRFILERLRETDESEFRQKISQLDTEFLKKMYDIDLVERWLEGSQRRVVMDLLKERSLKSPAIYRIIRAANDAEMHILSQRV